MIERNEFLFGLMGLLFALSGIFFAVSEAFDSKATNTLIMNIITFEFQGYLEDEQIISHSNLNTNLIMQTLEISSKNYICSVTEMYKNQPNPDQNAIQQGIDSCIDISTNEYDELTENILNRSNELKKESYSLETFKKFSQSMDKVNKLNKNSEIWRFVGIAIFILGFFIFYYLSLEFFIRKKLRPPTY
ncbi:MAG: hypothetical protein BWY36_00678 [Candidatus Diapherotrites archaeon ADurb.Bin253]|jgi:hypothetical protein|nr:MAG: hypothetical protein BWY36_00678 [Candidatus Diapherotrites archaeon ADurb.Bin253]